MKLHLDGNACLISDLVEDAEHFEARANHARGIAEKARFAGIRHYQNGIADACEDAAKCIRKRIEDSQPKPSPALRLVEKESA